MWLARGVLGPLLLCGALGGPVTAGNSNSLLDISSDGRLLACSNRDSGTVSIVDLATMTKLREIEVGSKPEGVSFVGASATLAVAVYGGDQVVLLDAQSGEITGSIPVFDEPYGIVSDPQGSRIYVTLDFPGETLELDPQRAVVVRTLKAGSFARGIALHTATSRLFVTEFYTSRVVAIDLATWQVVDEWRGVASDNLARQLALHPSRDKAYVPHIRSQITAVHGAGSIFPYLTTIDTDGRAGRRRKRTPLDSFIGNLVTANPWEVAVAPDGKQLFVVFAGTNDMFACRVLDDDYRELEPAKPIRLGANPRAVRVSPDGSRVFVYNALDFSIVAYDAQNLQRIAELAVTDNPLGDEVLLGKKLFYTALQPMASRRWISCSSCHPDGEPDGRTWHNPEGLRNTQSLAGMAWTHPIHWSADRDEVQDFEHTIRGPLMQGRGLLGGSLKQPLEEANGGRSRELDALAAYSNSHHFSMSPFAKRGLNEAAQRGRAVFLSDKTGCVTCHPPPFYTDSRPRPAAEIVRHDVGTGEDDPSEKMGPAFDTPSLLGIYRTAPYLHHGKAKDLLEVLTRHNPDDRHGRTNHLSAEQLADLVHFLLALPYEDPVPAAEQQGLVEIGSHSTFVERPEAE